MRKQNAALDLGNVRGIILDLDGVIYRGSEAIPGARDFINFLRSSSRRVVALTNHAGATAQDYSEKLEGLGIAIPAADIMTSAWATATYLAGQDPGASVYMLGSRALREELHQAGLMPAADNGVADYVVVGFDPCLNLPRLSKAVRHLLDGAKLVGTNPDALLPTLGGFIPECGPILAFLERATEQQAFVVGKPNPLIIDFALSRLGVSRQETLIVGDTPQTDIAAGIASALRTALVLTGNASGPGAIRATVTVRDLGELRRLLEDRGDYNGA